MKHTQDVCLSLYYTAVLCAPLFTAAELNTVVFEQARECAHVQGEEAVLEEKMRRNL